MFIADAMNVADVSDLWKLLLWRRDQLQQGIDVEPGNDPGEDFDLESFEEMVRQSSAIRSSAASRAAVSTTAPQMNHPQAELGSNAPLPLQRRLPVLHAVDIFAATTSAPPQP